MTTTTLPTWYGYAPHKSLNAQDAVDWAIARHKVKFGSTPARVVVCEAFPDVDLPDGCLLIRYNREIHSLDDVPAAYGCRVIFTECVP